MSCSFGGTNISTGNLLLDKYQRGMLVKQGRTGEEYLGHKGEIFDRQK